MPRTTQSSINGKYITVADGPLPMTLSEMTTAQLIQDFMGFLRLSSRYLFTGDMVNGTLVNHTLEEIRNFLNLPVDLNFTQLFIFLETVLESINYKIEMGCYQESATKDSESMRAQLTVDKEVICNSINYLLYNLNQEQTSMLLSCLDESDPAYLHVLYRFREFNYYEQFATGVEN